MKIRVNRFLNVLGYRGCVYGNMVGILGLMYVGFESMVFYYRVMDDMLNMVIVGLGMGVMYKVVVGLWMVVIVGVLGGIVVVGLVVGK